MPLKYVSAKKKILKQLNLACQNEDGSDDSKKGTQLLEVYALEIQMYTATKNNKRLKELYKLSLHIKSAIPHPKIMGIIRECGGKMHMSEGALPIIIIIVIFSCGLTPCIAARLFL